MIKLRVYGVPVPQGSSRAFAVRKAGQPAGRVAVTSASRGLKSWRQAIIEEWLSADPYAPVPIKEAVSVTLVFVLPRPAGHFGTGRNAGIVRRSAPSRPASRPDLDKLCRAVLDALTDAGAWRDDAQVTDLYAAKVYAGRDERPGVLIEVTGVG